MDYLTAPRRRLYLLVDTVMILLAMPISYALYGVIVGRPPFFLGTPVYYQTHFFIFLSWLSSLVLSAEYPVRRLTAPWRELLIALRVTILTGFIFASVSFLLNFHFFSRGYVITDLLVGCSVLILVRILTRMSLGIIRNSGSDIRTRIIIGNGKYAEDYIAAVERNPRLGLRIVGCVGAVHYRANIPCLGPLTELRKILRHTPVDGVVLALPSYGPETELVVQECELVGIPLEVMLDSFSSRIAQSKVVNGMGIPRIVLSNIPHSEDALALKRFTDIVISSLLLFVTSPLFAMVALVVKLSDGGPVFFVQPRTGLHGRTFEMYKFRTMVPNAEALRESLLYLNEMSGPVFKITNDPRVTKIGRLLRKTSLDELPQLFNVLKGDMSLVGPRPPLISEVEQYDYEYFRRLSVKPGITCLWQISGRNQIDFDDWMRLDLTYIDNWSYWADWRILLRTIPAVFKRRGAS